MGSSWGVFMAFKRGPSAGSEEVLPLLALLLPEVLNQPLNKLDESETIIKRSNMYTQKPPDAENFATANT